MISVYVLPNGDVAYRCSICDITIYVDFNLSHSPFWDEYIGGAMLRTLAHYMEAHQGVNSLPRNSHSEEEAPEKGIEGIEYRTRKNRHSDYGEWSPLKERLLFSDWYKPEEFQFRRKQEKFICATTGRECQNNCEEGARC